MEREELLNLVNEELGSTQLTLSEETINGELDDELEGFGEDAEANAKIVTRIANRLKRMDGQLHKDVSTEVKKYKKNQKPKTEPNPKPKVDDDETPGWFKKYQEAQEAKWAAAEAERKATAKKQERDGILKDVEQTLRDGFKKANIEANGYILRNVLAAIEIPEEGAETSKIAKAAEKAYYKDLKEAGLGDGKGKPQFGGNGGGGGEGGKTAQDAYFAKKFAKLKKK